MNKNSKVKFDHDYFRAFMNFSIIGSFLAFFFILAGCNKGDLDVLVRIEASTVSEVGPTVCTVHGQVIDLGDIVFSQHGFCYGLVENPTLNGEHTQLGERTNTGVFSDTLVNLLSNTKYYFRAYARSKDAVFYSDQKSFTTSAPSKPEVSTTSVSNITENTAQSGGNVTGDGGAPVTAKGVCWSIHEIPTLSDSYTTDGSGTGGYTSTVNALSCGTTYYVRAYATNLAGTSYGEQVYVTTLDCSVEMPTVTTTSVSNITENTGQSGGNVTGDGGAPVTAKGVCWSIHEIPTLSDNYTTDGSGTGGYTSALSGLSCGTTYYVRAYATNSAGTSFGEQVHVTTLDCSVGMPTVTTTSVSYITENSAQSGGNVTEDGGSPVTAKGVCWSTHQEPTLTDSHTTDGSGTGTYTSTLSGLSCGTTYYVRAYATNSAGTSFGEQVHVTTKDCPVELPEVTTTSVSNITESGAQSGGNVTDDGGAPVTAKGVCWSMQQQPTLSDSYTTDGSGTGGYTSVLSGLLCETTYYVRAWATNSAGTSYGEQISVMTGDCPVVLPSLTTTYVSNVTENSAQSGGNVTKDGGAPVTARGVCWSTHQDPTLTDSHTSDGSGTGFFSSNLTGLIPSTTYYVRAYATNSAGTFFGEQRAFTTESPATTVTDFDGNVYQIVKIGTQTWMQENLKTLHYSDGSGIQLVEGNTEWANLDETDKAYCFYDNSSYNRDEYGVIYSWAAVMNGASSSDSNPSGIQGICPSGWHVPSNAEWMYLIDYLGGSGIAGGKLKDTGFTHWKSPNIGASNDSEFTALPGGIRLRAGGFDYITHSANFWTTSTEDYLHAWVHYLGYASEESFIFNSYKDDGFYVRCVKD